MRLYRAATAFALAALLAGMASSPAGSATISFSGTSEGSDLNGPLMLSVPSIFGPQPFYAYDSFDDGDFAGTATSGLTTLASVNPADLTIRFDDLERLNTTFTPGGCTPSYVASSGFPGTISNCDTVTNWYGEGDSNPSTFSIELLGTPIIWGQVTSIVATTDSALASPTFTLGTGTFQGRIDGGAPLYMAELAALPGGGGSFIGTLTNFDPLCTPGTDPCTFSNAGSLSFVPEPASGLLLALGLGGLGLRRRVARQSAST